jgi:hypothetical protein
VVEIDESMLELIKKLSSFNSTKANGRSLAQVKGGNKKRKRREFNATQELETKIDLKNLKRHQ